MPSVVSHDCDIDKEEKLARVLVAQMARLDGLPEADRDAMVQRQTRRSKMPLPDVPGLGDYYADLRLISPVPLSFLGHDQRLASMSEAGGIRLRVQLVTSSRGFDLRYPKTSY